MYSNNRTSNLIKTQLPFYVRNEHPNFILFLEAYYEYLEQQDKAINVAKNLRTYRDVDLTEEQFSSKLYDTFMKYIPDNILADKTIIIKHIKDFYRAKGSEKSTKFLMRIMFNTEIDFYYPKKDIIRASDGKWYIQTSLRITNTQISNVSNSSLVALERFIGTQIKGITSEATALVERVDRFYEQQTQIDELVLSNINKTFVNNEKIYTIKDDTYISSNIFGGIINTITITDGGTGYIVNDPVIILSNTGSGACAYVSAVSTGNIASISVVEGGAGYRAGANVTITGGGGSGSTANVSNVSLSESIHPNSYNIVSSTISLEANTPINNTVYSNLNSSNANSIVANAVSYWTYSNTGPVTLIAIISTGNNYTTIPTFAVEANTVIYNLGILGRMSIVNGGQNYQIGDKIEFINVSGGYGAGATGNVTNINTSSSNAIIEVKFVQMPGHLIGGSGYDQLLLPTANVITTTGNGANIVVKSILGAGANLTAVTSSIGTINRIIIQSRGSGYKSNTTIDLSQSGDGTAEANVSVVEGVYTYPGRYLNDDGHISSHNFLEDRDYYQNYSYVIQSDKSISSYRDVIKNVIHPSGLKLWGEHEYLSSTVSGVLSNGSNSLQRTAETKAYVKTGNTINISYVSHGFSANSNVTLEYMSGGYANVRNGIYMISNSQPNYFRVTQKSNVLSISITNAGRLYNANSYLVFSGDGIGANASYTKNSTGSIVSVTLNEPGIQFTRSPTVTANGTNSIAAIFSANISYYGNTSGNVIIGVYN